VFLLSNISDLLWRPRHWETIGCLEHHRSKWKGHFQVFSLRHHELSSVTLSQNNHALTDVAAVMSWRRFMANTESTTIKANNTILWMKQSVTKRMEPTDLRVYSTLLLAKKQTFVLSDEKRSRAIFMDFFLFLPFQTLAVVSHPLFQVCTWRQAADPTSTVYTLLRWAVFMSVLLRWVWSAPNRSLLVALLIPPLQ